MKELGLSIKTTSVCQRQCKNCTVKSWMKANPDFHTSFEQIENLIKYSKMSGYHFEYILLSGGEPLCWSNVHEGTRLLYESGICSRLVLLTNGLAITTHTLGILQSIISRVHEFRISRYHDNAENIRLAQEYFGELKNSYGNNVLNVVDRQEHMIPPDKPVPDSLPAECGCKAYAMVGDVIDYCGPARTIAHKLGWAMIKAAKIDKPNFLDDFGKLMIRDICISNEEGQDDESILHKSNYCNMCISNTKVARTLKKEQA